MSKKLLESLRPGDEILFSVGSKRHRGIVVGDEPGGIILCEVAGYGAKMVVHENQIVSIKSNLQGGL